jgi:hypothetical protein
VVMLIGGISVLLLFASNKKKEKREQVVSQGE